MKNTSSRSMPLRTFLMAGSISLVLLAGCQTKEPAVPAAPAAVDSERLLGAAAEPANWMSHGRTYDEQRHSTLQQISSENVAELGLAWSFDLQTERGIEATSLVVDGIMYMTSAWSIVHALDARTGAVLWSYDPEVAKDKQRHGCCDAVNRGVAVWQGQVFVGVYDGRLVALDAETGAVNWSVATVDPELPFTITGAPRVIDGKILIGNGGAEFGVRGFISAYAVADGEQLWRFYTVPGNPELGFENAAMEMAAKTWNGKWWELGGGGGTVWDSMAYDPELDLLYIGVGNGTPWNQEIRSPGGGDNLFLSSIVALRPDSGEYVWHYQTTPGETWDYTATQHIVLADMELDGKPRKVLMQAPKNGFFYVLDRTDGTLLSANNYIDLNWATHVDMETGRPVEVAGARYRDETMIIVPSYLGGHNWHPMAYNPDTGLVYIPAQEFAAAYAQAADFEYRPGAANLGTDGVIGSLPDSQAARDAIRPLMQGRLLAWDPKTQSEAWRVEHTGPWNGGVLSTAGNLVFQGTADGTFVAYSADKGESLWQFPAQTGIVAPAITYAIDGEQYVSVNVGWGGAYALVFGEYVRAESLPNVSRVLTFKLGADGTLPPVEWRPTVVFNPPSRSASAELEARGFALYQDGCMGCHGLNAVSGLLIPDLRGSAYLHDADGWNAVVREGALAEQGMADFSAYFDREESEAIRAYVIQQAWRGKELRAKQ
ncbi:PQQ-dependent dehydrogenase, methanol/ethanol family [Halieaceae bacterium IMCC14734]|uniref:PQQ-dependent dehydrogenase, methanol/ethanol family n=1 Tax=Candidatus Litorirhabdus singularis TaxID=2518993 RepID=A0ABT3TDB1_9GAMM|nr:PQQ-dependent dehydrogenase, methanol/ethanol family [Candidatus Litorirhabdus singularis]MCX2980293.1 PQQ-dependent dehydrogenase, methanol/ethanol family [Candidatus Litorirhabdus singularis]